MACGRIARTTARPKRLESRLQPVNGRQPAEAGTPGATSGFMIQTSSAGSSVSGRMPRPR